MGAWRSSLKSLPQLRIQIEIVSKVLGDVVQWAHCVSLELQIPQTSSLCHIALCGSEQHIHFNCLDLHIATTRPIRSRFFQVTTSKGTHYHLIKGHPCFINLGWYDLHLRERFLFPSAISSCVKSDCSSSISCGLIVMHLLLKYFFYDGFSVWWPNFYGLFPPSEIGCTKLACS